MTDGAIAAPAEAGEVPPSRRAGRRLPLDWVGVAPFLVAALLFLILPTLYIVQAAFRDGTGALTLDNIRGLNQPLILRAYWSSLKVSFLSALIGCAAGFAIAAALVLGGLPRALRGPFMTFSGVASNFAGVPLAFAFIASVGPAGLFTLMLRNELGINLRAYGWNLFSTWGLILTYLYFQIPLMILIIAPAIDGLKKEWSEAAATLGATPWQFWRYVGLPVLWPNLLGTLSLLFANAFGAIATAYALTGSSLNIVPILLYAQIRGDVLHNPGLGAALALGMIVITALANVIYLVIRTRAERWLK